MTYGERLVERARKRAAESVRMDVIADGVRAHVADDSSGHALDHAWRVFLLGTRLADEAGADAAVVQAAALTHDLHRSMGHDGEYVHPEETLPRVREILEAAGFPEALVPEVLHCVEVHDEYTFRDDARRAESVEAEVLRDADNLDAIGAVGIARTFAFTGVVGNPLWDPAGDEYSGLGHFEDKLLHLVGEMHTDAARELAEERHAFLEEFKTRFEREWYGNA